jgi:predicted nucleotidyltransferase
MGIIQTDSPISSVLFNKTRRGLLALFYGHTDDAFYVNQIIQFVASGSGAVQRELRLMTQAGILLRTKKGNLVYYQANNKFPIFNELKSMANKGFFTPSTPLKKSPDSNKSPAKRKPNIKIPRTRIAGFCRRHHIRELSLFGSVLRDDFRQDSDVDVLVEFEPGHTPGWDIVSMEDELSSILARKADMHTRNDLSRYFRDQVVCEAEVHYSSE